jgi:hypothetical protein
VNHVQEELESSLTLEKCDFMDGCKCAIVKVIPEKARGRPFDIVYIYDTHTLLELRQRSSIV